MFVLILHSTKSSPTPPGGLGAKGRYPPAPDCIISHTLVPLDLLARGRHSRVLLCSVSESSSAPPLVLKATFLTEAGDDQQRVAAAEAAGVPEGSSAAERVLREIELTGRGFGPFVVTSHGWLSVPPHACLLLDYLPGGDLDLLLERSGPLGPQAARFYVGCAALGLEALHAQGVAHRDLKPENLCIDSDGYARIADLGYARSLPTEARAQKPSGAGLCRPARALTACCAVPRMAGAGANPARHSRVSRPGDFPRRGPRQRGRARWWTI